MYIAFQGDRYFLLYNSRFENIFCCLQKVENGRDIAVTVKLSGREAECGVHSGAPRRIIWNSLRIKYN